MCWETYPSDQTNRQTVISLKKKVGQRRVFEQNGKDII